MNKRKWPVETGTEKGMKTDQRIGGAMKGSGDDSRRIAATEAPFGRAKKSK